MYPANLDDVISQYEDALGCIERGRAPSELASHVISTTRWLSFLSADYLSDESMGESRKKIGKALDLAEQCSQVTGTTSDNSRRIWIVRQTAEIFRAT